jgi:hypothetical protein
MNTNTSASNALERARLAYEQMKRREYNAAMKRRARARARNIALAVSVGMTVTLVVGLSAYNGWMPTPLRATTNDLRASVSKFDEGRPAQVRSHVKGNTCQELRFSNESGALIGGSFVPCENESKREAVLPLLPSPGKGPRLNSIRDSFRP